MKSKNDKIGDLLISVAKGEEHIVRVKVNVTLHGASAIQYKLLRLLKKSTLDERRFVKMILFAGLVQVSKIFLKELIAIEGINLILLRKIFNHLEYEE